MSSMKLIILCAFSGQFGNVLFFNIFIKHDKMFGSVHSLFKRVLIPGLNILKKIQKMQTSAGVLQTEILCLFQITFFTRQW